MMQRRVFIWFWFLCWFFSQLWRKEGILFDFDFYMFFFHSYDAKKGFYCPVVTKGHTKCLGKSKGRIYLPMDSESEKFLQHYYQSHNVQLEAYLTSISQSRPAWLNKALTEKTKWNLPTDRHFFRAKLSKLTGVWCYLIWQQCLCPTSQNLISIHSHYDRNIQLSSTGSVQNQPYSKEIYTWCYHKPHHTVSNHTKA